MYGMVVGTLDGENNMVRTYYGMCCTRMLMILRCGYQLRIFGQDAGETRARRGRDAGETRARRGRELSQIFKEELFILGIWACK